MQEQYQPPTILVTKDVNVQLKARAVGLESEDYLNDKVPEPVDEASYREVPLSIYELQRFCSEGEFFLADDIAKPIYLKDLDFGVLAQCIHCGLCLPTCPTYDATKLERHSPRGRIQLMKSVAEGRLNVTEVFGDEMHVCLGCLACETACPAGVDYTRMFEEARADIERSGVLNTEKRSLIRSLTLRGIFTRPWLLRLIGRAL